MTENFFHYSDTTVFHGLPNNPKGFSFGEARLLTTGDDKINKLRERLAAYYLSSLNDINHPFTLSILTCIGIEVLGQVFLGFNVAGETIENHTIDIYKMLDSKMQAPISQAFINNYNNKRNWPGENKNFASGWGCYAYVVKKSLRNAFAHSYRSLGVYLSDSQPDLMHVDENEGCVIINPFHLRSQFIFCYNDLFDKSISNASSAYRQNAIKYFDLLIK